MKFDSRKPLLQIRDKKVLDFYVKLSEGLFHELKNQRSEIILIPAPDKKFQGHMIRSVVSWNPYWYSNLYWENKNFRRDRSLKALDKLRKLEDVRSFRRYTYQRVYREFIHDRLVNGYRYEEWDVPGENIVRQYYGLEKINLDTDFYPLEPPF